MGRLKRGCKFIEEWDMVNPDLDLSFEEKVSKPLLIILKDGRVLENCRFYPDTQRWEYMGLTIISTEVKAWSYMEEETIL